MAAEGINPNNRHVQTRSSTGHPGCNVVTAPGVRCPGGDVSPPDYGNTP